MCHQTVSLVSRHLEASGIPTVVIGAARDIVEECGVARFLFSDFPLGNPCGKPYDVAMQRTIIGMALDLLESARLPRTTVQTPFQWSDDETWKQISEPSLQRLSELAKMLEEAGLINIKEGKYELTPRAIRKIGQNALSDIFKKLEQDRVGRHQLVP